MMLEALAGADLTLPYTDSGEFLVSDAARTTGLPRTHTRTHASCPIAVHTYWLVNK